MSSSSASASSSSPSVSGLREFECPTRSVRESLINNNQLIAGTLCVLKSDSSSSDAPYEIAKFESIEPATGTHHKKKVIFRMTFYKASNTSDIDLSGRDSSSFSALSSDDEGETSSSSSSSFSSSTRREHVGVDFSNPSNTTWIPGKSWTGSFHTEIIFKKHCIRLANDY